MRIRMYAYAISARKKAHFNAPLFLRCLAIPLAIVSWLPTSFAASDATVKRALPIWFDQAKFGVMIHWGVYSVPSYGGGTKASEWFWSHWENHDPVLVEFMKDHYDPQFKYPDFANDFAAELFDPDQWVDIIASSGAKYVVMTSKHHEGFCNWKTNYSFGWNSVDVGPGRDLVGDFAAAVRTRSDMAFGIYHSLYEWFNPLYLQDKANNFSTTYFSQGKTIPELYELITRYQPELIWSDGEWEAPASYWGSEEFISWLYADSPVKDVVVVNNRWGSAGSGPQGDYKSFENIHSIIPLQKTKWENAITLDTKSWGYRKEATLVDYLSTDDIVLLLIQAVSNGGNLLLNIGPTGDGRILPLFEERLQQVGLWLKTNGEAIYDTHPYKHQRDSLAPSVWYTAVDSRAEPDSSVVYAILTEWPSDNQVMMADVRPTNSTIISLLPDRTPLLFAISNESLLVYLPLLTYEELSTPGSAWVLRLTHVL